MMADLLAVHHVPPPSGSRSPRMATSLTVGGALNSVCTPAGREMAAQIAPAMADVVSRRGSPDARISATISADGQEARGGRGGLNAFDLGRFARDRISGRDAGGCKHGMAADGQASDQRVGLRCLVEHDGLRQGEDLRQLGRDVDPLARRSVRRHVRARHVNSVMVASFDQMPSKNRSRSLARRPAISFGMIQFMKADRAFSVSPRANSAPRLPARLRPCSSGTKPPRRTAPSSAVAP